MTKEARAPKKTIGKYISHFARKGMPAVTEMKERSHSVINARKGMPAVTEMKKRSHSVINYRRRLRTDEQKDDR